MEFVTETRITAAKEMMATGRSESIRDQQTRGYDSAFYFTKVFKKLEGVSPREYKQSIEYRMLDEKEQP